MSGVPIQEIRAIRAKNYFILNENDEKVLKAKGAPKQYTKKWTLQQYDDAITQNKAVRETYNGIRSQNHKLFTYQTVNKKCMSGFDDKFYMVTQTEQRCHGHYLNTLTEGPRRVNN